MDPTKIGHIKCYQDDNGIIEILEADDYAYICGDALIRNKNFYVRDGPFIAFRGKTTEAWYELIEQDYQADRWLAKLIKKQGL